MPCALLLSTYFLKLSESTFSIEFWDISPNAALTLSLLSAGEFLSMITWLTSIIDDLIATGGTAEAAAKLVEKSGGKVAGFIFVIDLYDLGGVKKLEEKGYKVNSLIKFPGH